MTEPENRAAMSPVFENMDEVFALFEARTNLEKGIPPGNPNRIYRLDRMKALCTAFGNPQNLCSSIHVAGSKGKGSTAAYLAALLNSAGRRCGVYGSPHLVDYRERFRIEGEDFPEDSALKVSGELMSRLPSIESGLPGEGDATTFELLTLFAFLLFRECGCDTIVVETGLGGRLDATNVISRPSAVVLTPIEKEHTEVLGNRLSLIAAEKAGIIKDGVPVYSAPQKRSVRRVFRRFAAGKNTEIHFIDRELHSIRPAPAENETGFPWILEWENGSSEAISLAMGGRVQAGNAALALMTARGLGIIAPAAPPQGIPSADDKPGSTGALSFVSLPGRFHFLQREPPILIDGAHTARSIAALIESFASIAGSDPILLFGSVLGKDHRAMAKSLCGGRRPMFREVIVSTPGTFKPSDPQAVAESFRRRGADVHLIMNPEEALAAARELSGGRRAILVTGSFFMAGEIAGINGKRDRSE